MPIEPLGCLIVGWGGISRGMLPFFQEREWFAPIGVVDPVSDAARAGAEALGLSAAAAFSDLSSALTAQSPDVVVVNTPSEWHFELSKQALTAGCHVLVAKPVTNSFEDAVELAKAAEDSGKTLSVGQQIRYNRHYTAVADFVKSGGLGDVEAAWFMNSKPRPKAANLATMDQPALYENACHHFDSFLAIFEGRDPEWVSCDGFIPSWSPYSGPCMVNALIRFGGDLHMAYHGGFSSQSTMYEFRLEGTAGALQCHGLHMSNDTMSYELAPALGQFAPAHIDADIPLVNPWHRFMDVWHGYVTGGVEPPFSGRNNLKVFALLSAAIQSVEERRPVEIADNKRFAAAFV